MCKVICTLRALLVLVLLTTAQFTYAAASKSGVSATITTDGALVYASPDDQSPVIAQFAVGTKVQVSKGTTSDPTKGPEKFHKVRAGSRIGYIDDIDIALEGAAPPVPPPNSRNKKPIAKKDPKKKKVAKRKKEKPNEPIYFTRFVGFEIGSSEYKEGILNVDSSTTFAVYGLKVSGPGLFIAPAMDFNLLLHYGAPPYYGPLSATQPNGFVLFIDSMFTIPLIQKQDAMIFLSAGPLLVLSKYGVLNTGRLLDLDEINFGVDGSVGGAVRVGKIAFRAEAKYYIEKQTYKAFLLGVQSQF